MDRCKWIMDKDVPNGRYLVPACWSRVVHGDDAMCTCPPSYKRVPKAAKELMDRIVKIGLDECQFEEALEYFSCAQKEENCRRH